MFKFLARVSQRYRWIIVVGWLAAAVVAFVFSPKLSDVGINDDSQFLPSDTESTIARDIIKTEFYVSPDAPASSIQIVVESEHALAQADYHFASILHDWLLSDSGPESVKTVTSIFDNELLKSVLLSKDGKVMLINVGLSSLSLEFSSKAAVTEIREYVATQDYAGNVYVTGQVAISKDLFDSINQTIDRTTLVTILLVAALLLIAYRSPVASMVPLVAIGVSFIIARGLVGFLAEAGLNVSTLADAYLVVIIFGIGTDYCLFIISRYREELSVENPSPLEFAIKRIGPVITASAVTVIAAFLCLWISQFGMTKSVGIALALGVLITLLAGLTLVPSLMSIFGQKLFWPAREIKPQSSRSGWHRVSRLIVSRSWLIIIVIVVMMLIPYAALPNMKRSADVIAQIPQEVESARGFMVIQDSFPPGELHPLTLVLKSSTVGFNNNDARNDVKKVADSVASLRGIAGVDYFSAPSAQIGMLGGTFRVLAEQLRNGIVDTSNLAPYQTARSLAESLPIKYPGIVASQYYVKTVNLTATSGQLLTQIPNAAPASIPGLVAQLQQATLALNESLNGLSSEFQLAVSTPFTDWLYKQYFSLDRSYSRLNITLNIDPYSDEAVSMIPGLRDEIKSATNNTSIDPTIFLGGESARYADTLAITSIDFGRVAVLAIIFIFAIIFVVLRSLIAPLYMVATVLLNFGASLGISTFMVQDLFKQGNIIYILPLFIFVMLVAVGADYNIFLISRIKEENATKPIKEAVASSVANTGGVISTCGIILAGTFSVLILSPLQMVYQIGFAIAIGIVLDTFIVRALLVPAIANVVGRINWWPLKTK